MGIWEPRERCQTRVKQGMNAFGCLGPRLSLHWCTPWSRRRALAELAPRVSYQEDSELVRARPVHEVTTGFICEASRMPLSEWPVDHWLPVHKSRVKKNRVYRSAASTQGFCFAAQRFWLVAHNAVVRYRAIRARRTRLRLWWAPSLGASTTETIISPRCFRCGWP